MKVRDAIMAFSQSEKIKAGLIWVSQILQFLETLPEPEKRGAEKTSRLIIGMIVHEIQLGKTFTNGVSWEGVTKHIDKAVAMINSGVASEATVHLTQALSQVTSIGHRAMSLLKAEKIL